MYNYRLPDPYKRNPLIQQGNEQSPADPRLQGLLLGKPSRFDTTHIEPIKDPQALLSPLNDILKPGDVVLIEASRSVGLERFGNTLQADQSGDLNPEVLQ